MELRDGYKNTEVGIIPEDWEVKALGEVGEVKMCKRIFSYQTKENGDIPFYKIGTFGKEPDAFISKDVYDEFRRKYSFPSKGSVLISAAGTIGRTIVYNGDDAYFQDSNIVWIENNNKVISNEYLKHSFPIVKFRTEGGTIQRLYNNILKSGLFPSPPTKSEQTAIANALSDTDALINSLEKLIAKKRNIKQGAMQQLLKPKEGWEVKKLGEVIYLQGGYAFKSELFTNVGVPIIRISDVGNNKVETDNSVCYEPFNIPKEFVAKKGDVLIAMSGATTGKIGVYNYDGIAYINQRVGKFVVLNQNETSQEFISHIVRSEKFKENLTKEIAQGAQPNISGKQIQSIVLPIPNEKEEQDRIATILSDMDAEIAALETKLEKYKKVKLGMMQNLLTGKIRLI